MNHIGDMSTTTTPAAAFECWAPLCVWDSGECKRKGHKDHRGQGEKLPPCFSRQQMPPPPSPVQHLLALPFARRSKGRYKEGDGREPRRPFAHPTASQLERPTPSPSSTSSLLGENQGKTHQPHGRTRPWRARPTTASPDSSLAVRAPPPPHRHGTDAPRNPPSPRGRRAPHAHQGTGPDAQTSLLTHSAARSDGTALPGSGTALPVPPGAPSPALPGPTRLGRPRPGPTRRSLSTARSRRALSAHAPSSAATTGRHGMGEGGAAVPLGQGEPCLRGAFFCLRAALSIASTERVRPAQRDPCKTQISVVA